MSDTLNIPVRIRKAQLVDVDTMVELNRQFFEFEIPEDPTIDPSWPDNFGVTYFTEIVGNAEKIGLIAEQGGEVVGYLAGGLSEAASYRVPMRMAELDNMFVPEGKRGAGIGRLLTRAFLDWCIVQSATRVHVVASASNMPAIEFYRAMGFMDATISLELPL